MDKDEVRQAAKRKATETAKRKAAKAKKAAPKPKKQPDRFVIVVSPVKHLTEVVDDKEKVIDRLTELCSGFGMTVERALETGLITVSKGEPLEIGLEKARINL